LKGKLDDVIERIGRMNAFSQNASEISGLSHLNANQDRNALDKLRLQGGGSGQRRDACTGGAALSGRR
jgi:hypothetical protein